VQEAENTLQDILDLQSSQEGNVWEILIDYGLDNDVYVEEGDDIVASKRLKGQCIVYEALPSIHNSDIIFYVKSLMSFRARASRAQVNVL